jgi:hypothetical protein
VRAALRVKFIADVFEMLFHRSNSDYKLRGYLLIGITPGNEAQYLKLAPA